MLKVINVGRVTLYLAIPTASRTLTSQLGPKGLNVTNTHVHKVTQQQGPTTRRTEEVGKVRFETVHDESDQVHVHVADTSIGGIE